MPWFPTYATTGVPITDAWEYEDKSWDLKQARKHLVDRYDLPTGQTIFAVFGKVTVLYTVTQQQCGQGGGCEYQVRYVSDGGTILWFHTVYNRKKKRHYLQDTFTDYLCPWDR